MTGKINFDLMDAVHNQTRARFEVELELINKGWPQAAVTGAVDLAVDTWPTLVQVDVNRVATLVWQWK